MRLVYIIHPEFIKKEHDLGEVQIFDDTRLKKIFEEKTPLLPLKP